MGKYLDWFLRADFTDDGRAPRVDGGSAQTPDIWIAGLEPLDKPAILATPEYMAQSSPANIVIGHTNYIYVRAINGSHGTDGGRVYLYAMTAAYAQNPDQWVPIGTADIMRNYAVLTGEPHLPTVGDIPFEFTPRLISQSEHYCLIARIETDSHPNPLPVAFDSWAEFVKWLFQSPANSLRNVITIPAGSGGRWSENLGLPNFDDQPRECVLSASTHSMPVGSAIRMVCAMDGPNPPIHFHDEVRCFQSQTFSMVTVLPANFSGRLEVSVSLPIGQKWQAGSSVRFVKSLVSNKEEMEALAPWLVPDTNGVPSQMTLLKVGECSFEVGEV